MWSCLWACVSTCVKAALRAVGARCPMLRSLVLHSVHPATALSTALGTGPVLRPVLSHPAPSSVFSAVPSTNTVFSAPPVLSHTTPPALHPQRCAPLGTAPPALHCQHCTASIAPPELHRQHCTARTAPPELHRQNCTARTGALSTGALSTIPPALYCQHYTAALHPQHHTAALHRSTLRAALYCSAVPQPLLYVAI